MATLGVEGVEVLGLRATFLGEGGVLSTGGLEARLGLDLLDLGLLLGVSDLGGGCSLGLVDDLDDLSLNLRGDCVLLTLDLSDQHGADLLGLDNGDLLSGLSTHSELVLLDTGTVDL